MQLINLNPAPQITSTFELEGWSNQQKFYLEEVVEAIQAIFDIKIEEHLPAEVINEIKELTEMSLNETSNNPTTVDTIQRWVKVILDYPDPSGLISDTADAIRKIAEETYIPSPEETNDIDIKEVYHLIANALEGKPIMTDEDTAEVLEACIAEVARRTRHDAPAITDFTANLDMFDEELLSEYPDIYEEIIEKKREMIDNLRAGKKRLLANQNDEQNKPFKV